MTSAICQTLNVYGTTYSYVEVLTCSVMMCYLQGGLWEVIKHSWVILHSL